MDIENVLLSEINKIILCITEPHLKQILKKMKLKPFKYVNRIDLSFKFDTLTNDAQKLEFLEHFKEILREETTYREHEERQKKAAQARQKEAFINDLKNQIETASNTEEIILSISTNKKLKTNLKNYIGDILEEAKPSAQEVADAIADAIAQPIGPTKEQILNNEINEYYNEIREKLNDEADEPEDNENKYYFKNTDTGEPLTDEDLTDLKRYRRIYKIYNEVNKYISKINALYRNNEIDHTNNNLNDSFNKLLNLSYTEIFNEMKELKNKLKAINKFKNIGNKTDEEKQYFNISINKPLEPAPAHQAHQRTERNYFNISINKPLEPPEEPQATDQAPAQAPEPPEEPFKRSAATLEKEKFIENLEFVYMDFKDRLNEINELNEPLIFPDIQQKLTKEQIENLRRYKNLMKLYNELDEYILTFHRENKDYLSDNIDNEDLSEIIKNLHRLNNKIFKQKEELTNNLKVNRLINKINNFNEYPLISYENYIYMIIRTTEKFYILQPLKYTQDINPIYKVFKLPYEIQPNNKNNIRLAKENPKISNFWIYEDLKRMT
jgi:hypothetical protein